MTEPTTHTVHVPGATLTYDVQSEGRSALGSVMVVRRRRPRTRPARPPFRGQAFHRAAATAMSSRLSWRHTLRAP